MDTNAIQFKSFLWGGFECTYAKTEIRERLDMLAATDHERQCREDYRMLAALGIRTVREGLAWHHIDQSGSYDFSRFEPIMRIGKEEGMQQIWDLNHFDFPDYLDPFSERFVHTFAEYARRTIAVIRKYQTGPVYIAPINEISFFAWIGADRGVWAPYATGRDNGLRFKQQLVRAAIAAMDAIWHEDHAVRFLHIDPFMRRVAQRPASEKARMHVDDFNNVVRFEAWDMISGKTYPELGGHSKYLDVIGMNYYFHNQEWVITEPQGKLGFEAMAWDSPGRISLAEMIRDVHVRYNRPIVISETGSNGDLRPLWWERVLREVDEAIAQGLPVAAVCAYPVLDRPESINYLLPNSGLWDFAPKDSSFRRIPHEKTLEVISRHSAVVEKNDQRIK